MLYFRLNAVGEPIASQFDSILNCMYWCVVTITTVGYGDYVATSYLGRFVSLSWYSFSKFKFFENSFHFSKISNLSVSCRWVSFAFIVESSCLLFPFLSSVKTFRRNWMCCMDEKRTLCLRHLWSFWTISPRIPILRFLPAQQVRLPRYFEQNYDKILCYSCFLIIRLITIFIFLDLFRVLQETHYFKNQHLDARYLLQLAEFKAKKLAAVVILAKTLCSQKQYKKIVDEAKKVSLNIYVSALNIL